jgi:hypothetical protein
VRTGDAEAITVHWRYAFKREGRVAWHYCGTWPLVSLESIRATRDAARDALKRGADPNQKRQADRIVERERVRATLAADQLRRAEDATVEDMARAWLDSGVLRKDGNAELRRVFEKDLFPRVGDRPVRLASEQDLREALVAIVARSADRVAVRLRRDLRQMFAWAEKRQPWRKLLNACLRYAASSVTAGPPRSSATAWQRTPGSGMRTRLPICRQPIGWSGGSTAS